LFHLMTVPRSVRIGAIATVALVALLLIALAALWFVQRDRTLPNTSVVGVDVSGMTGEEVRAALAPVAESRETDAIAFTFEDERYELTPEDVGYEVDLAATVEAALGRGREALLSDIRTRVMSYREAAHLDLVQTYDAERVTAWVDGVADSVDRPLFSGRVEVDPATLEVQAELPHGSATVRRDEAVTMILEALVSDGPDEFELPVDTEPQRVPDGDVRAVAAQVEQAVAGPLELRAVGETLTLSPRDIASLIEVVERPQGQGATLELVVTPSALEAAIGGVAERFATEPVDARFVLDRRPPVTFDDQGSTSFTPIEAPAEIEPGREGTRFDPELAAQQITELLRRGSREAELRLDIIEPELPTELAEELRPTHLLGTFTTYHAAGQARVVNIQRLADEVDGATLLPGEQFSINGISGRRTCEGGYVPAGTIIRGELVDTCGGGTSQFGTTTYNAAFFAGVALDEWKAHSWYISRYPMGREATINYPELDVKFTNTTDAVVVVKTSYTPSSITVSVYGQPLAERVSAQHGQPFNHRTYSERVRGTSDLCEGQRRVVQSGGGGFTVDVHREIELMGGSTEREQIRTVYVPQTRIVDEGTRDCNGGDDDDDDDD
jgi:vancomycin resistance protein YoaR